MATLEEIAAMREEARALAIKGQYARAVELLQRAAERCRVDRIDERIFAKTLRELSAFELKAGQVEDARVHAARALDIVRRYEEPSPEEMIFAMHALAQAQFTGDRDLDGCLASTLAAIELCEATYGADDPASIPFHLLAGRVSEEIGEPADAFFLRVLDLARMTGTDADHSLAVYQAHAFAGLARVFHSQERIDDARRHASRAIERFEETLGSNHPDTRDVVEDLTRLGLYTPRPWWRFWS